MKNVLFANGILHFAAERRFFIHHLTYLLLECCLDIAVLLVFQCLLVGGFLLGRSDGCDGLSVFDGLYALYHYLVTGFQSARHVVILSVIQGVDLYLGVLHRVVCLHDVNELLILDIRRGRLRHEDDVRQDVGEDDVARRVAAQHVVRVGEEGR